MKLLQAYRICRELGTLQSTRYHVDRLHVSTPDSVITADCERAVARSKPVRGATSRYALDPALKPAVLDAVITYALACHRRNRRLYRQVMS